MVSVKNLKNGKLLGQLTNLFNYIGFGVKYSNMFTDRCLDRRFKDKRDKFCNSRSLVGLVFIG